MITTEYEYIHFIKLMQKPKTSVWACCNKKSETQLGLILWYAPWRQYCFCPSTELPVVLSVGCLRDIGRFIDSLRVT